MLVIVSRHGVHHANTSRSSSSSASSSNVAARRREERLLERLGAVAALELVGAARARAAGRGRGSRRGRRAPRPRRGRACRAGSSRRAAARISRMKSCTSSFERGSSPVVGSSSSSSTGEVSSARASATFCCMPRERFSIGSPRRSAGKPTRPRISGISSRVSRRRHPVEARGVVQVLRRRHLLEERRLDRDAVDEPPHGLRCSRDDVVAEDARRAAVRAAAASRAARTSVDLPEPFWPRIATHSPRVDREA